MLGYLSSPESLNFLQAPDMPWNPLFSFCGTEDALYQGLGVCMCGLPCVLWTGTLCSSLVHSLCPLCTQCCCPGFVDSSCPHLLLYPTHLALGCTAWKRPSSELCTNRPILSLSVCKKELALSGETVVGTTSFWELSFSELCQHLLMTIGMPLEKLLHRTCHHNTCCRQRDLTRL